MLCGPQNPVVARELTRIGKRDVEAVFMKVKQSGEYTGNTLVVVAVVVIVVVAVVVVVV